MNTHNFFSILERDFEKEISKNYNIDLFRYKKIIISTADPNKIYIDWFERRFQPFSIEALLKEVRYCINTMINKYQPDQILKLKLSLYRDDGEETKEVIRYEFSKKKDIFIDEKGRPIEFNGYWSTKEKELWLKTDWKKRNYEELMIEDDQFEDLAYFYDFNSKIEKRIIFVKYIRPNPVFSPYYGPLYTSELKEFMKEGSYCIPSYDGHMKGQYKVHNRFDSNELSDRLSR